MEQKITCGIFPAQDHEVVAFKEVLRAYGIPLLVYQIVEYTFRQAMSLDPRDVNKELTRVNWFGGYAYENMPLDPNFLKLKNFEERVRFIKKQVDGFNKRCQVGEFGFLGIGLNKFNNLSQMFEDYHQMMKSVNKTSDTKFLGKFEKYPNDRIMDLKKTVQKMIKESTYYKDRVPGKKLVSFIENGEMVISPKEYDYFIDYMVMSRLFWEPLLNPSGPRRGERMTGNTFLNFMVQKIRFEHLQNGVMTYNLDLKAVKPVTLDDKFFKTHFNATKIKKRLAEAVKWETNKERTKLVQDHFLQDWFVQGLEEMFYDHQRWERKLAG